MSESALELTAPAAKHSISNTFKGAIATYMNLNPRRTQGRAEGIVEYGEGVIDDAVSLYHALAELSSMSKEELGNVLNQNVNAAKETLQEVLDDPKEFFKEILNNAQVYTQEQVEDISNYLLLKHQQGLYDDVAYEIGKLESKVAATAAVNLAVGAVGGSVKIAVKQGVGQVIRQTDIPDKRITDRNAPSLRAIECSFHGSMQVKTLFGYKPISSIRINDWVFAKNEITGKTNYRPVLQTINSTDPDTTRITIINSDGIKQTIISDGLHPYFVDFTGDMTPPKPSTGHRYKGNLTHAYWVGAKDIEIGHRLIDDKGNYQTVIAIHTEATPLDSYNLEVDTDHTFFIKGVDGVESVWVHNKHCWYDLSDDFSRQIINNRTVYSFEANGRQVNVITNPNWRPDTKLPRYIEVELYQTADNKTDFRIIDKNKPDINYNRVNNNPLAAIAKDEKNQRFVPDPYSPRSDTGYHRPSLRSDTMEAIMSNYEKLPNGDYKNIVTDEIIKGPIDIGHAYGWEHRRLEIVANELNMTQAEFNDYVNARPEKFRLENMSRNRSHADEMPGNDIDKELKEDMTDFINKLRGVKK